MWVSYAVVGVVGSNNMKRPTCLKSLYVSCADSFVNDTTHVLTDSFVDKIS